MANKEFRLGVLKLGCIGAAPLLDLLLDERADRDDLQVTAVTSGAKLDPDACATATATLVAAAPDLVVMVSPNAALPGKPASRSSRFLMARRKKRSTARTTRANKSSMCRKTRASSCSPPTR